MSIVVSGNVLKTHRGLSGLSSRVVSGWLGLAWILGSIALGVLVAGALGGAIVFPLWILASRATEAYNGLVGLTLIGLILFWLVRKLRGQTSRSLLPILRKTGVGIVGLGGVYAFAILVWEGYTVGAVFLGAIYLVWLGASVGRKRSPLPRREADDPS